MGAVCAPRMTGCSEGSASGSIQIHTASATMYIRNMFVTYRTRNVFTDMRVHCYRPGLSVCTCSVTALA